MRARPCRPVDGRGMLVCCRLPPSSSTTEELFKTDSPPTGLITFRRFITGFITDDGGAVIGIVVRFRPLLCWLALRAALFLAWSWACELFLWMTTLIPSSSESDSDSGDE